MPELSLWRLAVFALLFLPFCVCFDEVVWSIWIDVPACIAFGLFAEWLTGALRFWSTVGRLRQVRRELREIRRGNGASDD